jgi:beta-lactamase regulating signal transducer with metallopeptidase domain
MSVFIDMRLEPGLWLLGEWSLRWAVLIAALAAWFAVRPPRQAALRLAACQFVLVAGLALPLIPHWWGAALLPAPRMTTAAADDVATERTIAELPEPALPRPIAKPTKPTAASPSQPTAGADSNLLDVSAVKPSSSAPARTAEPLGARRIALLIAAALWAVGACVQLTRLIAAALWLSHQRRSAVAPQLGSQELFDCCRQEIGLRRAVRLRIHSALTAPVFVGGWRCRVLVPSDWEQFPIDAQKAVLWHELAHVARRDDWAKLAEEAVRAAFFFHPLVYWLLNRIDGYREQVCDAAAVRRGVTGRMLAQILVDFSRRNSAPRHRDLAMRPALPFFRRRTVKNRIHELLEEKTVGRWSAPLMRYQLVGLAVIAASTGIALGGLGPQTVDSAPDPAPVASDAESQPPASSALNKAAATKGAADAPTTLERILANWKTRQERTKSVYFAWGSRMIVGQDADNRIKGQTPATQAGDHSRLLQFRFWAEEPDRYRLESVSLPPPKPTVVTFDVKSQTVWDGTMLTRLEDPGNAAGSPVCTISARRGQKRPGGSTVRAWPQEDWTLQALALTYRPQDVLLTGRQPQQFRVLNADTVVDGLHCVELQHGTERDGWVEQCWVDPARDDVVVAYKVLVGPDEEFRANNSRAIAIQYQLDRVHGWVPARWTLRLPQEFSVSTVTKLTINEKFPQETFTLKPAPRTVVFDTQAHEQYRVAQDGSKSDVVKFDSPVSLRTQEILETKTDFRIEPQSLKDAIDFISARYQIPIVLNQREFDAAGIDTTSEVQFTRPGIAVAELLKILLAQMSKPIGFRIENEVLKISPKFAGQGQVQAHAVPAPEKLDSPTARQIQTALEQPVDFNIEPQSLKDAIDFIRARYQIPIALDPSIDATTEVKGAFPGIRLRNLLILLFERCPKPLGFKIENQALKIFPESAIEKPAAAKPADLHKK